MGLREALRECERVRSIDWGVVGCDVGVVLVLLKKWLTRRPAVSLDFGETIVMGFEVFVQSFAWTIECLVQSVVLLCTLQCSRGDCGCVLVVSSELECSERGFLPSCDVCFSDIEC